MTAAAVAMWAALLCAALAALAWAALDLAQWWHRRGWDIELAWDDHVDQALRVIR